MIGDITSHFCHFAFAAGNGKRTIKALPSAPAIACIGITCPKVAIFTKIWTLPWVLCTCALGARDQIFFSKMAIHHRELCWNFFWKFLRPSQIFANITIFLRNSTCNFQNWINTSEIEYLPSDNHYWWKKLSLNWISCHLNEPCFGRPLRDLPRLGWDESYIQ